MSSCLVVHLTTPFNDEIWDLGFVMETCIGIGPTWVVRLTSRNPFLVTTPSKSRLGHVRVTTAGVSMNSVGSTSRSTESCLFKVNKPFFYTLFLVLRNVHLCLFRRSRIGTGGLTMKMLRRFECRNNPNLGLNTSYGTLGRVVSVCVCLSLTILILFMD